MGINKAKDISVSGITANRIAMEIIASNIANMQSTRSLSGGFYRRRIPVFSEVFKAELDNQFGVTPYGGVSISDVIEDPSPGQRVFNPGHPDADEFGFVTMPNVSLSQEMVDMIYTSKLYEANILAYNTTRKMSKDALQIQ